MLLFVKDNAGIATVARCCLGACRAVHSAAEILVGADALRPRPADPFRRPVHRRRAPLAGAIVIATVAGALTLAVDAASANRAVAARNPGRRIGMIAVLPRLSGRAGDTGMNAVFRRQEGAVAEKIHVLRRLKDGVDAARIAATARNGMMMASGRIASQAVADAHFRFTPPCKAMVLRRWM